MNTDEIVKLIKDAARQVLAEDRGTRALEGRLGKIDPSYASGLPKVLFDGETTVSTKTYPYLASYTPAANDRVELLLFGSTWVVQGKVIA